VRILLLDRGFWSVAVIRYLQQARYPFLMPVVLRGRKDGHPQGPSGTRVFALRKRGGWAEYTVTAGTGQKARVSIGHPLPQLPTGNGEDTAGKPWCTPSGACNPRVRAGYGRRTGSVSRSRPATGSCTRGRARTCTRNPLVRLLLVGVALVPAQRVGVVHYAVLSTPRRGNCRYNLERLTLKNHVAVAATPSRRRTGTKGRSVVRSPYCLNGLEHDVMVERVCSD